MADQALIVAELKRALRARGLTCPAIVIASTPKARHWTEVGSTGAPLLEKPLMGRELSDHIHAALARR